MADISSENVDTASMDGSHLSLRVANLDCDSDASRIERGISGVKGVTKLKVYPKSARVDFEYDATAITPDRLKSALQDLGFPSEAAMSMAESPRIRSLESFTWWRRRTSGKERASDSLNALENDIATRYSRPEF